MNPGPQYGVPLTAPLVTGSAARTLIASGWVACSKLFATNRSCADVCMYDDITGPNYLRQYKADESYTGVRWQTFPSGDGLGMTFSKVHCAIFLNDRARIWKFQGIGCPVITTTTVTATTTTTATITTTTTTTTLTTPTKEGNNDISARLDEVAADVTNLNAALDTKASADSMVTKLDEQSAAFDAQIKALTEAFDLKLQAQDKALTESFELKLQAQEQTMNRLKAELQEQQDTTPCAKFGIEANSDGVAVCTMQVDAIKGLRDN